MSTNGGDRGSRREFEELTVTTWTLEMTDPSQHERGRKPDVEPVVMEALHPAPELSEFFYKLVGGPWQWTSRLSWTKQQWFDWANKPEQHLLTCWVDGVPAGYVEFEQQGTSVEIWYFGLVEEFHGNGLGSWLLSYGIDFAWLIPGTERVWLHTCSHDGPVALANYQARGFVVTGTEVTTEHVAPPRPRLQHPTT